MMKMEGKEKDYMCREELVEILKESKTDFILVQKGKGHYSVVGFHEINNGAGDTCLVMELGKRIEG